MAHLKKNQLAQVLFPMVDKTDFATIESAITQSNMSAAGNSRILYGVKHGGSVAQVSKSISKTLKLVQSGIWRATIKAAEISDFDYVLLKFTHPSAAVQLLPFQVADFDDSDIYSLISDLQSDFQSRVPKRVATDSQLSDLHSDLRSFLTVMSGVLSDTYSLLSDHQSDFQSRVPKRVATDSQLSDVHSDLRSQIGGITATVSVSDISDIASRVWSEKWRVHSLASSFGSLFSVVWTEAKAGASRALLNQSRISDTYSLVSDFYSDFQSRVPKRVATDSQLSDLHSDLRSFLVGLSASLSDVQSVVAGISDVTSNINSVLLNVEQAIVIRRGTVASNVVGASLVELDAGAAATNDFYNGAQVMLVAGTGANQGPRLITDYNGTTKQATVKPAWITNPASDTTFVIRANSPYQSQFHSDLKSLLSDLQSDFQSRVPKRVATDSQLSDLHSDLRSFLTVMSGVLSDTYSLLSDHQSDFQSRVPKRVATDSQLSDVHSDLRSQIAGITATVSASDISDIASRVWSEKWRVHSLASSFGSAFSALWTEAKAGASRALLNQSRISDVYSLVSDLQSDFQSRVPKRVATDSQLSDVHSDLRSQIAGITATVSASDISDIASRVWSEKWRVHSLASSFGSLFSVVWTEAKAGASRALLNQSRISDAYSLLSDFYSDFQSRVPKRVATDSQLSDLHSDLRSFLVGLSASLSDVQSVVAGISDVTSNINSVLLNIEQAIVVRRGTVASNVVNASLIELDAGATATNDFYNGAQIMLAAGTGANQGPRLITDYNGTTKQATVKPAWITNPASDTTFVIRANAPFLSQVHSDLKSLLSDLQSDFQSRVPKRVATDSQLSDLHSDLRSFLTTMSGVQSDVYSLLSDLQSDFQSRVPKRVATDSQLSDLHSDLRSYLIGISGTLSDVYSLLSDANSDLRSQIQETLIVRRATAQAGAASTITLDTGASATNDLYKGLTIALVGGTGAGQAREIAAYNGTTKVATVIPNWTVNPDLTTVFIVLTQAVSKSYLSDLTSDLRSFLVVMSGVLSDTYSLVSDLQSDFQSRVPKRVATDSQLSDLHSDLRSFLVAMSGAQSDIYSLLSDFQSDFQSRIPGAVTPSDVASKVWAEKYTAASNVKASSFGSLARINMSRVSDIYSLVSDLQSDFQSRVPKRVATDSQLSDVHSDLRSFLAVMSGILSDSYSLLSDLQSDFQSRVPKRVATDSQLSDVHSDLRSQIGGITVTVSASDISDIASRVWSEKWRAHSLASSFGSAFSALWTETKAGASRALLNQSRASDIYSLLSDLQSDFQSRVPKRVATDSQLSGLHSDLSARLPTTLSSGRIRADAEAISGSTTAADNLEASADTMANGTIVSDSGNSTTKFKTNLTETTDSHYNGRIAIFKSGALADQATDITAYNGSTKTITVTALTEVPATDDTFIIV